MNNINNINNVFRGHPTLRQFFDLVVRSKSKDDDTEIELRINGQRSDLVINEGPGWYCLYDTNGIYDGMDDDEIEQTMYELELIPGDVVTVEDIENTMELEEDHLDEPLCVFKFDGWDENHDPVWAPVQVKKMVSGHGIATVVC